MATHRLRSMACRTTAGARYTAAVHLTAISLDCWASSLTACKFLLRGLLLTFLCASYSTHNREPRTKMAFIRGQRAEFGCMTPLDTSINVGPIVNWSLYSISKRQFIFLNLQKSGCGFYELEVWIPILT